MAVPAAVWSLTVRTVAENTRTGSAGRSRERKVTSDPALHLVRKEGLVIADPGGRIWRAHPSFGFRQIRGGDLRAMTMTEIDQAWTSLPEDEQLQRENEFYSRLLLSLASACADAVIIVETAEPSDSRTLELAGYRRRGPARYEAPMSAGTLRGLLNVNPTWATLVCDGKDVALIVDTWDGFYLLRDPETLFRED